MVKATAATIIRKTLTPLRSGRINRDVEAEEIRAKRLERGLSQENLARELGVTHHVVYRWEKGSYKPSARNQKKLEAVFRKLKPKP